VEFCPCCGDPAFFRVAGLCCETRETELDACCEANLAGWNDAFAATDRRTRVGWMVRETGLAVRDVITDGSCLSRPLDYGLILRTISFQDAASFVNEHHRHNPAPQG
jgi:hypothetical protein